MKSQENLRSDYYLLVFFQTITGRSFRSEFTSKINIDPAYDLEMRQTNSWEREFVGVAMSSFNSVILKI